MMVQGLGYLPPMGETWLELLTLAWPSSGWLLGCLENSQWMEVPLSVYLSAFQVIKKKIWPHHTLSGLPHTRNTLAFTGLPRIRCSGHQAWSAWLTRAAGMQSVVRPRKNEEGGEMGTF